jgi:cell cycle checkpoint control protein RAD9A
LGTNVVIEILKQPLHTTIAIDTLEFSEFSVEEKLHIAISVKDFKAIVTHAGISNTIVSARYSQPSKPMQLKYSDEGVVCEFILMTIGDFRGSSTTPAPAAARISSKSTSRQPLEASNRDGVNATLSLPPPSRSVAASTIQEPIIPRASRPSPPPQPSLQSYALFFPENDDDRKWDPAEEDGEETLGWDMSGDNARIWNIAVYGLQADK